MNWDDWLRFVSSSGLLIGIMAYLSKTLVSCWFNKDLQKFKLELEKEMEIFKSELKQRQEEYSIKYSILHAKRAEVIDGLYSSILVARQIIDFPPTGLMSGRNKELQRRFKEYGEKIFEMIDFYAKHKIYFSEDLCKMLDAFKNYIFKESLIVSINCRFEQETDLSAGEVDVLYEEYNSRVTELNKIQKMLEDEFRMLLGVTSNSISMQDA